jgi:hypothetical protein
MVHEHFGSGGDNSTLQIYWAVTPTRAKIIREEE